MKMPNNSKNIFTKCCMCSCAQKLREAVGKLPLPSLKMPKIPFFVIAFSVAALVVVMAMFTFHRSIDTNLNITDHRNISAITSQEQAALNDTIASIIKNLTSITKTLVTLDKNTQAKIDFLQNVKKNLHFETILMVDMHGQGLRSTGQTVNVRSNTVFMEAMKGNIYATDIHVSEITGHDVISIGVPIRSAGRIVGTLIAEFDTPFIEESLVAYTENKESAFILDSVGATVASSSDVYNSLNFLRKATFANGMTYQQFLEFAKKTRWGGTSFTLNGENKIIEFRPLDINSWTLFLVSHDLLANPVRDISVEIQYVVGGMLLIFLFIGAYMVFLKRKTLKDMRTIAFYDELTGLANNVKFSQDVEAVIKKSPNMKYVMQKMDLENFKAINEMFEYEIGDMVLQKIADALRHIDDDSFLCARVGNDEFLMFSAYGFLDDDNTRTSFESYFKSILADLKDYEFTFRYGRYFIQKGERNIPDMINKTTLAHSMAKSLGHKNTWDYDDTFRQEVRRSTELINLSKLALQHNEFIVYLQPKYNLKEKKVTGGEALVRWAMDDGTLLLPDEFIPIFEQNGFVTEIDFYVLRVVCARIKTWIDKGHKVMPISVNFSRVHLRNPNFVQNIKNICAEYGDIHQFIEVELTETAVTENAADLSTLLDALHDAGFTVAIDDFGAGYSSLGMLKDFRVDVLKLDQSFFDDNQQNARGNIVVNGISAIAHDLGMKIVAEGIEFSEQFTPLEDNHLELAQGFFFAKPMPMEEFEQKYFD